MNIYLMRHGSYDDMTGHLDDQGRDEVITGVHDLHERGVGALALILCSTEVRTEETAQIAAEELPARVIPVDGLKVFGLRPRGLASLDNFINETLSELEIKIDEASNLLIVTHEPLINRARQDGETTKRGEIIQYQTGSWQNPSIT